VPTILHWKSILWLWHKCLLEAGLIKQPSGHPPAERGAQKTSSSYD